MPGAGKGFLAWDLATCTSNVLSIDTTSIIQLFTGVFMLYYKLELSPLCILASLPRYKSWSSGHIIRNAVV